MASIFQNFIFPPPNMVLATMSAANVLAMANAGYGEMTGTKHMQYSKFADAIGAGNGAGPTKLVASKRGMVLAYAPAAMAALASLAFFPDEGLRFFLVRGALSLHFFKRTFEVLFIHKYSGSMSLGDATLIGISYLVSTSTIIYTQHLSMALPEPQFDLTNPGILLFLVGLAGNFYHHYLLSKLRSSTNNTKEKAYKVPNGGLFGLVICPHYLFEILAFWGIAFVSQTTYGFSVAIGTSFYLMGRSCATRRWYMNKFEDFPNDVKAIIPFVF